MAARGGRGPARLRMGNPRGNWAKEYDVAYMMLHWLDPGGSREGREGGKREREMRMWSEVVCASEVPAIRHPTTGPRHEYVQS